MFLEPVNVFPPINHAAGHWVSLATTHVSQTPSQVLGTESDEEGSSSLHWGDGQGERPVALSESTSSFSLLASSPRTRGARRPLKRGRNSPSLVETTEEDTDDTADGPAVKSRPQAYNALTDGGLVESTQDEESWRIYIN